MRCAGAHIQILLHGEKTVDYIEADPAIPRTGLIGLQIHCGKKAGVSFRNITLGQLAYGAANRCFGIAKSKWKVVSFSSENIQVEDERAVLAVDDNPDTFGHTQWSGARPGHPHHLAVDMGERISTTGFTYLPRQDGRQDAGVIGEYELLLEKPAAERYFKILSLSAPGSQLYAGAAETSVLGVPAKG